MENRSPLTPQLAIGTGLVLFGVLLTLDRFGLIAAGVALRLFWPLAIVSLGSVILMQRRGHVGGILLIFIGAWMFLNVLGVLHVRFWSLLWPAIIIAVGAKLILQARGQGQANAPSAQNGSMPSPGNSPPIRLESRGNGTVSMFAVLGSATRASNDKPFRGGEMTSVLGGCHLDLRQAVIPLGGEAVIDVFSLMGGNEVWVPADWNVASEVMPVLGSVDDKRLPPVEPRLPNETAPRVVFRGMLVMGGLMIKS